MTVARSMQINLVKTRYYHVVSRCVRRAFLCGWDKLTRKNFDHRKEWLVERMKMLSSIFSIQCAAYAAMQNHLHLCVYVDCEQAAKWSDDEVICRWGKLFPGGLAGRYAKNDAVALEHRETLLEFVSLWRERLSSLSWYMKCLKEYIARKANKEDDVDGYFWQGRFRCQALLDEAAVQAAMCYIDLNPIRAQAATTLENSDFTSVQERIESWRPGSTTFKRDNKNEALSTPLMPFQPESEPPRQLNTYRSTNTPDRIEAIPLLPLTLTHYLVLVDWTGRQIRTNKPGHIDPNISPILSRLGVDQSEWVRTVVDFNRRFRFAAGSIGKLEKWCEAIGRGWLQGRKAAGLLYAPPLYNGSVDVTLNCETVNETRILNIA